MALAGEGEMPRGGRFPAQIPRPCLPGVSRVPSAACAWARPINAARPAANSDAAARSLRFSRSSRAFVAGIAGRRFAWSREIAAMSAPSTNSPM